ncbi:Modulator of FtsH protease YccA [Candidatus Propionivibrio aalborgensis]|uniref:Modulator of FtsH protease YccA n=1 Tax=Candidatus Propionivibrio aalborgensis TaxID=1860101 RepID=A0A1A8XR46_9RHOO|nr:Bax inhibitor-1 family protein [Candidatus Propionivibrio aalborgensis]SBT07605.1 Modulator of FtsH protease YccA [Candidatus Propionivibrio aalborgensis]
MNHLGTQAVAQPRRGAETVLAANKVIRNTYMLLSMTLLFAAVTAAASVAMKLPHPGMIITLVGYFGLLFATHKLKNSGWGLVSVFALTGFMGYTLGPIVGHYLGLPSGGQTVMMAMAGTAAIFLEIPALSLTVSAAFVLLMSGLILFETSNIIHGGETNYVMATVTLFVSIFNLFTSLLHLLGFMNSND